MKDEKKEKTDLIEVDIPVKDKDFGLHPAELEDEINRQPVFEKPVLEKDCKVQTKGLSEPEERQEESKPKMITIPESEKPERTDEKKRCPFDSKLECKNCRLSQTFLGTGTEEACSVVRIAQRMPL